MIIRYIFLALIGLGSGVVISGAVFAFIAIVGVVPRMAEKTNTEKYIKAYETSIILGGFFGVFTIAFHYFIPINIIFVITLGFAIGIFFGCMAVAIAEVLNVMPILSRRTNLVQAVKYFILSLAIGKTIGAIIYYNIAGFYNI